ncbi:MAG: haloacid dehalogenase type II [Chlorobium phaeobacteroides]|uniref:Haloacid dehalogenase, type II n=1 Tax=Chlorobium phaeobacteroides (strain BS1) TaxID=331678 RepID=B3ENR9_CHLPB|nr:haloacid dehalogenase type II [Chlorobium phaeobacteroides]
MTTTLAFDVYGTLIDTDGLVSQLRETTGEKAGEFSRIWRDKQLEYSFRRGLMQNYATFAECTRNALDYTCDFCKVSLTVEQKEELLESYRTLPAFNDVEENLQCLKSAGFRLFAFSNGSADAVETVLGAAGIRELFLDVVSVDDLRSFKPNPAVYSHFLRKSGTSGGNAWLISGNPFDVIGAVSAGMRAVWAKRSPEAIFDPWGIEPTLVVSSLAELDESISAYLAVKGIGDR